MKKIVLENGLELEVNENSLNNMELLDVYNDRNDITIADYSGLTVLENLSYDEQEIDTRVNEIIHELPIFPFLIFGVFGVAGVFVFW